MAMPYSYDTDRAPLWVDSRRGDLDEQAQSLRQFSPTQPAPMDAGQLRRDAIASASHAPRVPRLHRLAGVALPACQGGECEQGRGRCATPGDCLVRRLEPVPQEPAGNGRALIWLLCLSVLLCMGAALLAGVEWTDVISLLAAIGGAL